MAFAVLVLMVFFCAVAFMQQMKKDKINAGAQDQMIRKVLSRYKNLREHQDEVKANAFAIGPAKEAHKGGLRNKPSAMAVRILDDRGRAGTERRNSAWRSLRSTDSIFISFR